MLKHFRTNIVLVLANRISAGFVCGLVVLLAVTLLFNLAGAWDTPSLCEASELCIIGIAVVKIEIILLLSLAFGVGLAKSLIDALRDIHFQLQRLDLPSTQEEPK